jgi:hypothetical protein
MLNNEGGALEEVHSLKSWGSKKGAFGCRGIGKCLCPLRFLRVKGWFVKGRRSQQGI